MADQKDLNEQLRIEKELLTLQKERQNVGKDLNASELQSLSNAKQEIKALKSLVAGESARLKEFQSFASEFRKLSQPAKDQLKTGAEKATQFENLARVASKQAGIEARTTGIVSQNAQMRKEAARAGKDQMVGQASAAGQAMDDLKGISSYERERLDLEAQRSILGNETTDALIDANLYTEQLNMKTDILTGMMDSLPGPIQSMVNGAKSFGTAIKAGMGPLFIIAAIATAALKSFTDLDASARAFRDTTGMTNSQMDGIKDQANNITQQFASAGVNAEKVFNTMSALTSEFTDMARFSDEVVSSLTLLNTNFGVSAESAAKVQGVFEQIGGLSSETAASVQMQVAQMANLAGVAPAKIFEDIADSAEIASTLFQGDVESLTKAAIEARRLGSNLKSVAATSEHLLDFQSNIGDELVAATFAGGQFSLTQARSLAAAGKHVDAQKEVLRQLQRSGDFRKKDYFTQQQMAKAAGMSVEDINKQLNAQEKLNSLTSDQRKLAEDAISQGLDISDINKEQLESQVAQFAKQQEMQGQVDKLSNSFTAIAASLGTALVPALDIVLSIITPIAQLIGGMLNGIIQISTMFGGLPGLLVGIIPILMKASMIARSFAVLGFKGAIAAIFRSFAAVPFGLGIPLAIAGVAGLGAMMKNAKGTVGTADDMRGVPSGYGNTMVTTAGKGTLALNNNDSFVAGTNLGQGGGNDAKMDMLIAAVKETKDIYMDGRRVTSRVASSVEKSSKNQYGFG
jgi:hypothetical protein